MPADNSVKAQAHADWLANGLTTKEIISKYTVHLDTALAWIKQWHAQQISEISQKIHFNITVTDDNLKKHNAHVDFLASECVVLASEVESATKGSKERKDALTAFLKTEKRWSELVGIEAKVASNKAWEIENAKHNVQQSKIPPSKRDEQPRRISGPVVPVD